MRPRNQPARDQLTTVLARRAAVSATSIAEQLGVSIPTLHRLLQEIEGNVVDIAGRAERVAGLTAVHPHGACLSLPNTGNWRSPQTRTNGPTSRCSTS